MDLDCFILKEVKSQKPLDMKRSFDLRLVVILLAAILYTLSSTGQRFKKLDEAPHDISYYRATKATSPLVKVLYGRPSITKSSTIFGKEIPFNQLWRTGANEATEIKLYKDVMFGDKLVNAGTYALYTIPNKNQWEIILSSNTDVLGAYQYDTVFDVARILVPVQKSQQHIKTFSIYFEKIGNQSISMILAWGTTRTKILLDFNEQEHYASVFNLKKDKNK